MKDNFKHYLKPGKMTEFDKVVDFTDIFSNNIDEICQSLSYLTVHHNLLPAFGMKKEEWMKMKRLWPPKIVDIAAHIKESGIQIGKKISLDRKMITACMFESHFLASILRSKNILTRIRAGYFQNVRVDKEYGIEFWENNCRERGIAAHLFEENPEEWKRQINGYTAKQIDIDHKIEHWICEYWDGNAWRLLDYNTDFLLMSSNLEVDIYLSPKYFEHAASAWQYMRNKGEDFNPDQYYEEPQDGRSHIRSQMLWDFYSLLGHEFAGINDRDAPLYAFVKEKMIDDVEPEELEMLDRLAVLLVSDFSVVDLKAFYQNNLQLQHKCIEII